MTTRNQLIVTAMAIALTACSSHDDYFSDYTTPTNYSTTTDDSSEPDFDYNIAAYDGETATDASDDIVGTDEDIYWEANSFGDTVSVTYNGTSATVTSTTTQIATYTDGARVTIDMLTNEVKGVNIVVQGKSSDGQLKIYGSKKFKLTLNGVELTSSQGPAINDQCKKRVFIHLTDGTTNRLTDAASYSDDSYYLTSDGATNEDRKGALFSEGNVIVSGTGTLIVTGNYKHGLVTDGSLRVRPGVTLVATSSANDAVHAKGDSDDGLGMQIMGGLVYANTTATAGKALKTDLTAIIDGGQLLLNTSGGSEYDSDDNDVSSPSCLKAGNIYINGGTHTMKSTGQGGKGISADSTLYVNGGTTTITTTGTQYVYNSRLNLDSSPKGVKADGDININGGYLNISVTGKSDGSEGLESKANLTINDGEVYVYAYDDAINASTSITVNGGKTYCNGVNNDGMDSNGTLVINDGLVIACGTTQPEEGFDSDQSSNFRINGGTVIGIGGTATAPSSASSQRTVVIGSISGQQDNTLAITNSSGTAIMAFTLPRTLSSMSMIFSSPSLTSGTYTLLSGTSVTAYTSLWNGYYTDATLSGGSTLASFTSSSTVTQVNSTSTGGGMTMPGGGNMRW